MPPTRKVQGRITPAKAIEEATALVGLLATQPDAAFARGEELAQSFSLAPRMSIVKELGAKYRSDPPPHPLKAVGSFLATLRVGVKPAQEPEYAAAVLELAHWCRGDDATLAEELFLERISGGPLTEVIALSPEAIPAALASDTRFVAVAARVIRLAARREKATPETLRRWSDLIDPLLGSDRGSLQESAAGDFLVELGNLPAELPPTTMFPTLVRLVASGPSDRVEEFYASGVGVRLLRWLKIPSPAPSAALPGASLDLLAIKEGAKSRLHSLLDEVFAGISANELQGEPRQEAGQAKEVERLATELAGAERERDAARELAEGTQAELVGLKSRLDEVTAQLAAVRAESEQWRSEVSRREGELGGQFRIEQQQEIQRQSRLLTPPLREVHDHLVRLLTADRRNEPLRRLAVSFDSLQKNLGRVLGTSEIQRLPHELLARPQEGAAADARND